MLPISAATNFATMGAAQMLCSLSFCLCRHHFSFLLYFFQHCFCYFLYFFMWPFCTFNFAVSPQILLKYSYSTDSVAPQPTEEQREGTKSGRTLLPRTLVVNETSQCNLNELHFNFDFSGFRQV